jgi:hypothetical protein
MSTITPTSPERSFEDRLLAELLAVQAKIKTPVMTRRRRVRVIAVVAVAVAVIIVVVLQVIPGSVNTPLAASAAGELQRLSVAARSSPGQTVGPGQYLYTEEVSNSGPPAHLGSDLYEVQFDVKTEFWIASNGSGRSVFTLFHLTFPTTQDRSAWVAEGSPDLSAKISRSTTFGPGNYGPLKLDEFTLPTRRAQLAKVIAIQMASRTKERPGTSEYSMLEFGYIGQLLHERQAPPKVRAALLGLAASIPGIILIGATTAPGGLSGVGISTPVLDGFSNELVFNSATGALVAYEQWQTNSSGKRTLEFWTSYLASGVVNNTSATVPAKS